MSARTRAAWWLSPRIAPAVVLVAYAAAPDGEAVAAGSGITAQRILEATGVQGGLIVHVGCGNGQLTAALHANESYLVHGLDANVENVRRAREHIQLLGLYGKVAVDQLRGNHLPYIDNHVNLLVSEDLSKVLTDEVMRVLVPDGVAYIKKGDTWTKTVKPRPEEIDEWTHFLHGPDNNAVARDAVVGPPYHLQWVGGPKWARSHDHLASVSVAVSAGGRIFYIVDEGPTAFVALPAKWCLVARDAFNGVLLWKRPIGPWEGHLRGFRSGPSGLARRLVAVNDRVYVTLGYGQPVSALEAATGETVKTYEGTDGALEIVYDQGVLFIVAGDMAAEEAAAAARRRGASPPAHHKRVIVMKADSGDLLWAKTDGDTTELMPTTLATQGGRVFFQSTDHVICLDRISGKERWRADRPVARKRLGWSTPTLVVYEGVVLSADRGGPAVVEGTTEEPEKVQWEPSSAGGKAPGGELIAFSVKTGERLWSCECRECYNAPVDVLVAGGLLWTGNLVHLNDPGITRARNPATGEVARTRPADEEFFQVGMTHHRCYRNKATSRYLLLGRAGVEFIELTSGKGLANHWVRGTCQYGILPCNGLLYAPPHSCACYIQAKLNGFNALAPKRQELRPAKQTGEDNRRLEPGPAYGKPIVLEAAAEADWPTYRHDPARSGHTESAVPPRLEPAWRTNVGGRISSVVIAEGKVFVAQVDAHTVHALDARDGNSVWTYTAGGRVDSPPTVYQGLVLFGSADGWVYCLRASDGQLVWRFRAAPEDRRVVAYGQLESVWPVHGNVLVQGNVASLAAGRSSFLDGGIYLYRLDPKTGEKLSETCVNSRDPETGAEPQESIQRLDMPGALPDVLSSDGTSVYMRHMRFGLGGVVQEPSVPHLFSSVGFLDDTWWHRTYWFVGTHMGCGYGSWPKVGNQVPSGRLLVSDASAMYGFGRNRYAHHGSHVGLDAASIFHFRPKRDARTRQTRYCLFAADRKAQPANPPTEKPATKSVGAKRKRKARAPAQPTVPFRWSRELPLLVRAMVLADETLFVAGPADVLKPNDSPGAVDGRKGPLLRVVSTNDGKKLAEYKLSAPPVFDGLAAANGSLYLSTTDGKVSCFAGK